jgi:hypothetical protein
MPHDLIPATFNQLMLPKAREHGVPVQNGSLQSREVFTQNSAANASPMIDNPLVSSGANNVKVLTVICHVFPCPLCRCLLLPDKDSICCSLICLPKTPLCSWIITPTFDKAATEINLGCLAGFCEAQAIESARIDCCGGP